MKNDIRFNILKYFEKLNNSTVETVANEWLSRQHSDLGTIRRSLIDLIESDFIRLSSIGNEDPVEWLNKNWDSTSSNISKDDKDKKSSKRLVEKVGNHDKVKDVKMYTTVKGLIFIKEYRRFRYHYVWTIAMVFLSFILGLCATWLLNVAKC